MCRLGVLKLFYRPGKILQAKHKVKNVVRFYFNSLRPKCNTTIPNQTKAMKPNLLRPKLAYKNNIGPSCISSSQVDSKLNNAVI